MTSAGKKAARTKLRKYGAEGISDIAKRAAKTKSKLRALAVKDALARLTHGAKGAKSRAVKKGLEIDPDLPEQLLFLLEQQKYRCAVSGVAFSPKKIGEGQAPRPFAPSIDRIDSNGGYTAGNIRVICWACNCFFGVWGSEPAERLARGIVAKSKNRKSP